MNTTAKDRLEAFLIKTGIRLTNIGWEAEEEVVEETVNKILADILELIGEDELALDPYGMTLEDGKVEYAKMIRNQLRAELRKKLTAYFTNKRGE